MITGFRTCPSCGTRVLPNRDDTCPACLRHRFVAGEAEASPAATSEKDASVRRVDRAQGEGLYRKLWALVIGQIVLAVLIARVEQLDLQLIVGVAAAGLGLWTYLTVYRLVVWLKRGQPMLWALGLAVPFLGLVLLLVLMKRVSVELESLRVP